MEELDRGSRSRDDRPLGAQPFLKWAGGKSAIAPQLERLFPKDVKRRPYREPFVGGGAVFFHLEPETAYLSDALTDLVNAYNIVQTHVEALIHRLVALRETHSTEQYYAIRDRFNGERGAEAVERAAWLVYLNKTCFN